MFGFGFTIYALVGKAAVIDARRVAVLIEVAIDRVGPMLAPCFKLRCRVPLSYFKPKTVGGKLAHRQQDMRMVVALVGTPVGRMDCDIRDHAVCHKFRRDEFPQQLAPLLTGQLVRKRQQQVAGELRVLSFFGLFNRVPEPGAILHPGRCIRRGEDFGGEHAALTGIVEDSAGALIVDALARSVGGGSRRAAPLAARNDFCFKAIDRHCRSSATTGRTDRNDTGL